MGKIWGRLGPHRHYQLAHSLGEDAQFLQIEARTGERLTMQQRVIASTAQPGRFASVCVSVCVNPTSYHAAVKESRVRARR